MKKLLLLLLFLSLLLAVVAWQGWTRYDTFLHSSLAIPAGGAVFQVEPGTTGSEIVKQLGAKGFTRPGWQWRLLMRLEPHVYQAGEYRLTQGSSPRDVLNLLSSGQVLQYRITLVEGWTFKQFAAALASNPDLVHELDLEPGAPWPAFLSDLDIEHPEGWFLPETYQFTRGDSDRDILV
ncbi:MAG: endolytic transglycosylase MltG, partial [Gammaproteobacteria bacterium]|nr:endolytic transglycosylase MltG [Gammaproteobacteria bacterium]